MFCSGSVLGPSCSGANGDRPRGRSPRPSNRTPNTRVMNLKSLLGQGRTRNVDQELVSFLEGLVHGFAGSSVDIFAGRPVHS